MDFETFVFRSSIAIILVFNLKNTQLTDYGFSSLFIKIEEADNKAASLVNRVELN
jgi:hypothetical protein